MKNEIRYSNACIRIGRPIHSDWFLSEASQKTPRLPGAAVLYESGFSTIDCFAGLIGEVVRLDFVSAIRACTRRLLDCCIDQFSKFSFLFFSPVFLIIHSGSNNHQKRRKRKTLCCFSLREGLGMREERKSRVVSFYSYLPIFYSIRRHHNKFRFLPSFFPPFLLLLFLLLLLLLLLSDDVTIIAYIYEHRLLDEKLLFLRTLVFPFLLLLSTRVM